MARHIFLHNSFGFDRPVRIVTAGDEEGRLFIAEQGGTIRIVINGFVLPVPFSRNIGQAPIRRRAKACLA
jgi:hypothetical protein